MSIRTAIHALGGHSLRPAYPVAGATYARDIAGAGGGLPGNKTFGATTESISANFIWLIPFFVQHPIRVWGVDCVLQSGGGAGTFARPLIYNASDVTVHPNRLVWDGGPFSCAAAAVINIRDSFSLDPGVYWSGIWSSGSPNMRTMSYQRSINLGILDLAAATHVFTLLYPFTYGGGPPSPITGALTASQSAPRPILALRWNPA